MRTPGRFAGDSGQSKIFWLSSPFGPGGSGAAIERLCDLEAFVSENPAAIAESVDTLPDTRMCGL